MSRKSHTLSWRLTRPIRLRISLGFREVELLSHHPVRYKAIAQSFLMQIAVGNISTHGLSRRCHEEKYRSAVCPYIDVISSSLSKTFVSIRIKWPRGRICFRIAR